MLKIDTPRGHLKIFQAFGITTKQFSDLLEERITAEKLVEKHWRENPLLLTDLNKK
jgi:hypothetical protein